MANPPRENRGCSEPDTGDWEHAGKCLELERRLREDAGQQQTVGQNAASRQTGLRREPYYRGYTEGGPEYETDREFRLHRPDDGDTTWDEVEEGTANSGGENDHPRSGATDWQDYEDFKPDYSGHQASGQRGRSVLRRGNQKGPGGSRNVTQRRKKRS